MNAKSLHNIMKRKLKILYIREYIVDKSKSVPIAGLADMIEIPLYGYLCYHIREVFSFIGEFGGAICLNHQIRN